MAQQFGFWTHLSDMEGVQLNDEGEVTTTFMAMPYGEYEHPVYGKLKLNAEKAGRMVQSIVNKVRGTDLDIDYDHKQHTGAAAGWIQGGEARSNGLFLTVKWTKNAWEKIKAGEYKYFSPEYHDEWKHPKTGDVHKDVLFGGGITNRPFLKDILPINMSELFAEQTQEAGMDPKKRRALLGLPEDATDEQCETAEDAKLQELEDAKNKDGEVEDPPPVQVAASELPPEVLKLAEDNPAIKMLTDVVAGLQKTVQTQSVALQLSETSNKIVKLSEQTPDGRVLSAGAQRQLQEILLNLPRELSDKVVAFVEGVNGGTAYVQLGETKAGETRLGGDGDDATKKFNDAVEKKMAANKEMDYGTAVEQVSSENPTLFESYRQQSYAFRETN